MGSSLVANAARASHRRLPRPLVLASQGLAFRSPGELLFGAMLLYYFRVLERQTGSRKYGSYAAGARAAAAHDASPCARRRGAFRMTVDHPSQHPAFAAPSTLQLG